MSLPNLQTSNIFKLFSPSFILTTTSHRRDRLTGGSLRRLKALLTNPPHAFMRTESEPYAVPLYPNKMPFLSHNSRQSTNPTFFLSQFFLPPQLKQENVTTRGSQGKEQTNQFFQLFPTLKKPKPLNKTNRKGVPSQYHRQYFPPFSNKHFFI